MSDQPSPTRDPRLEIPEVLRTPVAQSEYDPVYGTRANQPRLPDLSSVGRAWGTAMNFVFTILAGAGAGWLFDRWRTTLPWGTLIGLALGFVLAFVQIVRQTQREERAKRSR
ncbi:MAG: AtpZ/AtpI family protein [Phycisphaerales bacterium]|nr:AtpZ/AtpI family protein [Phycisphaerales bacterium]